ncbi:hypothetical protein [Tepidibacter formicigenes]|uniref:Uncharacterized protein n=1 Tax=Tepidibacter formicigenes DSM 15518 TaxID=1123349 RepID=A0A1M6T074_9FIRM|nr:hypothetical protein [Tepidibacter formicigenes]SHK50393.1 hypothetical protein SAMN02744037_02476 [Tepidibacter formicigenes DSM 15518]
MITFNVSLPVLLLSSLLVIIMILTLKNKNKFQRRKVIIARRARK